MQQAFERMRGQNAPSDNQLQAALTTAASGWGPWPSISVWHGTHDQTVKPVNAEQIARQWAGVHQVSVTPDVIETINGHSRRVWRDESGRQAIEVNLIKGLGHGVPLSFTAEAPMGQPGPFMLEAGISSTARIAMSWGLTDKVDVATAEGVFEPVPKHSNAPLGIEAVIANAVAYAKPGLIHNAAGQDDRGVRKVLNDALRPAGLMR